MRCRLELNARQVRRRVGWLPRDARLIFVREPKPYGWDTRWFAALSFDEDQFLTIPVLAQSFLTSPTGSNQTYTSDVTWNNSNNKIEVIGAASSGNSAAVASRGQGGAGAYSSITNFSFATPGTTTATYQIGTGGAGVISNTTSNAGGSTWFNNATDPGNGADNTKVSAQGGQAATSAVGGAGGLSTSSWGQTKFSGGKGLGGNSGGAGGAAGPNGAGSDGTSTNGGNADNNTVLGPTVSAAGNSGTEFDGTHGCGTGAFQTGSSALAGGLYGGGSTATSISFTSSAGAQGIIVLTWTPATGPKIILMGQSVL
jgi:hypothetical protein